MSTGWKVLIIVMAVLIVIEGVWLYTSVRRIDKNGRALAAWIKQYRGPGEGAPPPPPPPPDWN